MKSALHTRRVPIQFEEPAAAVDKRDKVEIDVVCRCWGRCGSCQGSCLQYALQGAN